MVRSMFVCLIVAAALGLGSPLHAQRPGVRRGLWLAAGVGAGSANISCNGCPSDRKLGILGNVQIGGTPSSRVLLGIEGTVWRATDPDTTREFFMVTAGFQLYPNPSGGFFIKGAMGAGRYAEESTNSILSSNGFAVQVGAGYDVHIGRRFWLTPFFQLMTGPGHNAKRNRLVLVDQLEFQLLQFGGAIRYQ